MSARMRRRPLIIVLAVLCLVFLASYAGRLAEYRRLQMEKAEVQTQILESGAKGRELMALLDYVKSPEYVEEIAITKLGMAQKNDRVLTIIDAPQASQRPIDAESELIEGMIVDDPTAALSTDEQPSIWRQWVSVFLSEE